MKYLRYSVFLFILLAALCVESFGKISEQSITSGGKRHTYHLFVPDTFKAPAPLLIMFHGLGGDGSSLVKKWINLASKEGIVLVGPDAWRSEYWRIPQDGPGFLIDLAEELTAKYPIDPRRIYLFGHSNGAVFALTMSMLHSQYFAAAAIHAGAWQSSQFPLTDVAKRKIPIAIFVGDRDEFFPVQDVNATSERLKQKGFPVELTIRAGHDHGYFDLAGYINEQLWNFMKKYRLSHPPAYDRYSIDK